MHQFQRCDRFRMLLWICSTPPTLTPHSFTQATNQQKKKNTTTPNQWPSHRHYPRHARHSSVRSACRKGDATVTTELLRRNQPRRYSHDTVYISFASVTTLQRQSRIEEIDYGVKATTLFAVLQHKTTTTHKVTMPHRHVNHGVVAAPMFTIPLQKKWRNKYKNAT